MLAVRCVSWRGEQRAERRFRATDRARALCDWCDSAPSLAPDGLKGGAVFTVFPRREVARFDGWDLAALGSAADFDAFERREAAEPATAEGDDADAGPTLGSLGVESRTVLSLVRENP